MGRDRRFGRGARTLADRWGAEQGQTEGKDPASKWGTIHKPEGGASALWFLARKMDPQATAKLVFTVWTEEDIAASEAAAAKAKGPSMDDVQKAAEALQAGELDGAARVFDLLASWPRGEPTSTTT